MDKTKKNIDIEILESLSRYIEDVYLGAHGYAGTLEDKCYEDCLAAPMVYADALGVHENLEERLQHLDESFAQTVLRLIDEAGLKDAQVYKRANMSRQLFSKLRKDQDYRPTKRTVCALAFALELNLEDASALLERAGFSLSHSSKFDVIVEFFLMNEIYDIMQVNEALYAYDQPLLG